MPMLLRTVRVFISSTFRDMHAERDHLVRVVFPELRERMAKRHLNLIDIDLRWGVTEEEAEHGKVLEIILDEIDRCRPFFIAVLGERYGFVPKSMPGDAAYTYSWLPDYSGYSYTALEVAHAVIRNPELARRSFFYFRDPAVISGMPEARRADYLAENAEAETKIKDLKEKVSMSGRPVMENYPCRWDSEKGTVTGLDAFGQQVLEDLWQAICEEYPEEMPEPDPLALEREMHEAFAEERSRLHVGQAMQAESLTRYVKGMDWRPLVITGESGCGKSAFLASWYRKYTAENPDDFVFAYFIGASPDSTNHFRLLRNMCLELKRRFDLKEEIPDDDKKLPDALRLMLLAALRGYPKAAEGGRLIIITDALDQLLPLEGSHGLNWLLDSVPAAVRLVVSSLESDCLYVLRRRGAEEITLPPLAADEQKQIIRAFLGEWRRKLDEQQMSALLDHPGTVSPLYLRVALEELRLFGIFEKLMQRIQALPPDTAGLFEQVLSRIEEDHGRDLVTEAFTLLGCSRYGLSETELLDLLRREGEGQFPRALWLRLARGAKAYLVKRGEFFGFFHRHLADAVTARYLSKEKRHVKLAAYFNDAPVERKVEEYPYQLWQGQDWKGLADGLSNLELFSYALGQGRMYQWMWYWRSLEGFFQPGECYQKTIDSKIKSEGETPENASAANMIGLFLEEMALFSSALSFINLSLRIREAVLGPEHPDVATSLNNLATLYHTQSRYDKSEQLYKRSLELYEKVLGLEHSDVATQSLVAQSLNNLATLYHTQGRYEEAEQLLKKSLIIREKVIGTEHSDEATQSLVAQSLNNLATLYYTQGRYGEAEPLYTRALLIREKALGPDHPNVANFLNNLGELYRAQGRYDEAEHLFKRSLSISEEALGQAHPDVASSLGNLAELYRIQGRYGEAEPLCKRMIEIYEKTLGTEHSEVALSLNYLAVLYMDQGRYKEVKPLYTRALEIYEKTLGTEHPRVALSLSNLAELYRAQGRYVEAEPLHKSALEIFEKTLGPEHPDVALSLNNLAVLYHNQGRYGEAEPLYNRALEISVKTLGPEHPDVAQSLDNLAVLYSNQGRYGEAEPLYTRALLIREKALGPDHPNVANSLNNLATLYFAQGNYGEAEPLYRRALKIAEDKLGPNHPEIKQIKINLMLCKIILRIKSIWKHIRHPTLH